MEESRVRQLFVRYRDCLAELDPQPRFAPYPTFERGRWDIAASVFIQLSDAQVVPLANSVNELSHYAAQLRAWAQILGEIEQDERFDVVVAFVLPLAFFALGAPYMIKQRFCRSIAELSHQATRFRVSGWKDDIDLSDTNFKLARKLGCGWKAWPDLESALSRLNSDDYKSDVYDFRNEFHHGFPRQIEVGMTPFVRREVEGGSVSYAFGAYPPLRLNDALASIEAQRDAALEVFDCWFQLVTEQRTCIAESCLLDG